MKSPKPEIEYDAFAAVDIRVGTITRVEDVPHSDKLVRLIVSFGDETRRILTGIKKERANPQELTGRQTL
ncbi:MAG: tRNA-binding protein, partial [Opitutus sp.]